MFAWLARLLNYRTIENPAVPLTSDSLAELFEGGLRSGSGIKVNNKSALTYSAVYRAVNTISRDIAKLPWLIYKRTADGRERDPNHPAFPVLRHKANADMLAYTLRQTLMHHVLLHGNGYAWILRNANASPLEMLLLDPITTIPVKENGRLLYVVKVNHQDIKVDPADIFHLKGLGYDGLVGWSVLTLARESLGLGMAQQRYGSKFFANSARPSVVIEHPGRVSEIAGRNLKASWNKMHQGLDQSHRTAILEEGMQLKPFSITAKDSQLIESQEFGIRQIANWFSIPAHKLGDPTRTSYKSLEQENQQYLDEALDPWLVGLEEEARDKLLTERQKKTDSHFTEFRRQALIQTNLVDRYRAYRIALGGAPFMTRNEVRAAETLPSIEGGDELLIPMNMGNDPDASDKSQASRSEEEGSDNVNARHAAHADLIKSTVGKVIRSIEIYAIRASRKPAKFLDWLDGDFQKKNDPVVRKVLDPLVRACSTLLNLDADELLDRTSVKIMENLRVEMLRVSGECTADELENGITVLFEENVPTLGELIANEILNEGGENET